MKRPILIFAISLIVGIVAGWMSRSYFAVSLLTLALAFIAAVVAFKFPESTFLFCAAVLFCSIGAFEYLYVNDLNSGKYLKYAGDQIIIHGSIDSEPDIRDSRITYVLKTESVTSSGSTAKIKGKILLTTPNNKTGFVYGYGRKVRVRGQINIPKGIRNPGGFDYRTYLKKSGISATVFVLEDSITMTGGFSGNLFKNLGFRIRDNIVGIIKESLPEDAAGLLSGMLIGYREGLTKEVQETFSDAGLSHIMAVSGANVAFIVMPLVFLLKKLRFKQKVANIIIILLLILFVYITGFSPSVVRAVIMAIIMLTGQMLRRETDVVASLSLAAILLLLYNPYTLFDIGFQLSFAATLSLVMFYKFISEKLSVKFLPSFITNTAAVTLAAQVGVLPVTAFYFNKISIISILSNILVVPVVEIITLLGFGMVILGQVSAVLAQLLGYINYTFLSFVLFVSRASAEQPFAVLQVMTPPLFIVIVYYISVIFFLWYKPRYRTSIGFLHFAAVYAVILVMLTVYQMIPKELEVIFLDVGEGDSTFIRTSKGNTVLIDGGGFSNIMTRESSMGDTVVLPFLLDYGVTGLDLVVASHGHDDHIQGLLPVLKNIEVRQLVLPYNPSRKEYNGLLDIARARGTDVEMCDVGDVVRLDNKTFFSVLSPKKDSMTDKSPLNNESLVLKLHYGDTSVLFTGDIEEEIEKILVEERTDVKADVIKISHHGSISSTSLTFLQSVKPRAAVISVGKNNFGHPSPVVEKRLADSGIEVYRTDLNGAVILSSDGKRIKLKKTVYN